MATNEKKEIKMAKYLIDKEANRLTTLFLSVLAGGVVGAATAFLIAPTTGKKLRKGLCDTYEDISERGQEMFHETADFAENVKDKARKIIDSMPDVSNPNLSLLIGAVGGSILGAAAIYMLTPKAEEGFAEKIKAAGGDWLETARDVLETLHQRIYAEKGAEELEEKKPSHMKDALALAALGLRLWDNIKQRR
jgi:gas vesicle protein